MNRLFANQWPLSPSQQVDAGREFIGLADIIAFVRRYLVTLIACLATALAAAGFYIVTTDPVFTATAQILIEPKLPQHLQEGAEVSLSLDTAQVESQIAVMESEKIASMVIERLGLIDDPTFNHPATPAFNERLRKMREAIASAFGVENSTWLSSILDRLGVGVPVPPKPMTEYQRARHGMMTFRDSLDIRRVGVSYAIDIKFTGGDPERAAQIANATAEAFVQEQIQNKAEAARQGGAWLETRLQQLRKQMNDAMAKAQEFRSRHDYSVVSDRLDVDTPTSGPTLEELEVTADTYKKMYESFLQAYTNSVSQQSYPVADARVITAATAPLYPSAPKPKLVLAFAAVAGLVLGIGISLVRHSFDWTVRSAQQIRDSLDVECVGELPAAGRKEYMAPVDEVARAPGSRYSQSLRKARAEISLAETDRPVKLLGITAVSDSRQKSSIVSNLATLYATAGLKTLVVDADVDKSFLTLRLLGRVYPADLSPPQIMQAPERPFDVLPAWAVKAWNLRKRNNMQAFLADLGASEVAGCERAYDIVIVDMPTLQSGADDVVVGSVLDGVVVVAEWGRTHLDTLRELIRTLQANRAPLLGVLLAGVRKTTSGQRTMLASQASFAARQGV